MKNLTPEIINQDITLKVTKKKLDQRLLLTGFKQIKI